MQSFFQWMSINWTTICAWGAGFYAMYKIGSVITAVASFVVTVTSRFKNAESTLSLLASNHLPHLQAELEKFNSKQDRTNEVLSEIREDLRLVLFEKIGEND